MCAAPTVVARASRDLQVDGRQMRSRIAEGNPPLAVMTESIAVLVTVPGAKWEVEFFEDGHVEVDWKNRPLRTDSRNGETSFLHARWDDGGRACQSGRRVAGVSRSAGERIRIQRADGAGQYRERWNASQ